MNLLFPTKGQYSNSGFSLTKIKYFFQSTNYFIRITQLYKLKGVEEVGSLGVWEFGSVGV